MDQESSDESSDATEEVDELDSGSNDEAEPQQPQPHWEPTPSSASANAAGTAPPSERPKAKKRPKPATTRMPGQALVPVNRVESILQQDRESSPSYFAPERSPIPRTAQNANVSKEAIYIIALATVRRPSLPSFALHLLNRPQEEFIRHITRVSQARAMYDKRSLTTLNDFGEYSYQLIVVIVR